MISPVTIEKTGRLSFSLAVLIIQFYKYSSYIDEVVGLKIRFGNIPHIPALLLTYSLSNDQTFRSVQRRIKEDIDLFLKQAPHADITHINHIHIEWTADNNRTRQRDQYLIKLFAHNSFFEPQFFCKSSAFFFPTFRNATRHFKILIQQAFTSPQITIKDISYLSYNDVEEIESLYYGPVNVQTGQMEFLPDLFEKTVTQYPNQTAIVCPQCRYFSKLSYHELNVKANRLAHFLIREGVKQGDLIGILLTRTSELYIAILGILKAGAAYVPLDTGFPGDRIQYILEDAAVKLLISRSSLKKTMLLLKEGY